MCKDKCDIRDKNEHTVLATVLIKQLGSASQYRMQVSNMFTVNFTFCPLKANTWRLENIMYLALEMSLNNT